MDFSHAPSLEWIENAGWIIESESFERGDPANIRIGEYATDVQSETPISLDMTHVNSNERGIIYRISADVRAATPGELVDVNFILRDALYATGSNEPLYISYPLIRTEQIDNDWVSVSGEFEFWSTSGLQLHIESDFGLFMHRNLRLDEVGPGSLSGNPLIPPSNQIDRSGPPPDVTEFLEQGWQIVTAETQSSQAAVRQVAIRSDSGAMAAPDFALGCESTITVPALYLKHIYVGPEETYRVRAEFGSDTTDTDAVASLIVNAVEMPQSAGMNAASLNKLLAQSPVSTTESTTVLEGVFASSTLDDFRFYLVMDGGELDLKAFSIHKVEPDAREELGVSSSRTPTVVIPEAHPQNL